MQQTQLSQLEVGDYYKVDPDGSVYVVVSVNPQTAPKGELYCYHVIDVDLRRHHGASTSGIGRTTMVFKLFPHEVESHKSHGVKKVQIKKGD